MNKQDWARSGSDLARTVFTRFLLSLMLFTGGYLLLFFGMYFSLSSMTCMGTSCCTGRCRSSMTTVSSC